MKTRNPFDFVRTTYRNSPWIVISVSVHVIALAILAVWVLRKPEAPEFDAPLTVTSKPTRELPDEPPLLPAIVQDRTTIPKAPVLTDEFVPLNDPIPVT